MQLKLFVFGLVHLDLILGVGCDLVRCQLERVDLVVDVLVVFLAPVLEQVVDSQALQLPDEFCCFVLIYLFSLEDHLVHEFEDELSHLYIR